MNRHACVRIQVTPRETGRTAERARSLGERSAEVRQALAGEGVGAEVVPLAETTDG